MMRYAYYNVGTHWGLWILMSLAMLVFWGILAWAVVNIARHKNAHSDGKFQSLPGTGGSDANVLPEARWNSTGTPGDETSSKEAAQQENR